MHIARHPAGARTLLCVLALALWLAATLGLVHRTAHDPGAAHAVAASSSGEAHAPHGMLALFGAHTDAECRLYDQLSSGAAAPCVPPVALPLVLPAATFAWLEGQALVRRVALFEARGPPSAR